MERHDTRSYEARTTNAFVQQVVRLIAAGYRWDVTGKIPGRKDPRKVDEKLVARFGAGLSRDQRRRRKEKGRANVAYVRYGRWE